MRRALAMCFDRRVLVGLGAVAVGVWLLAPQLFLAALPVLIVLACPLSMLAMAWMMRGEMGGAKPGTAADRLVALEHKRDGLSSEIAKVRGELDRVAEPAEPRS